MSKIKKEKYYTRYLTICQGDVLLVNFAKGSTGCRTGGMRPCVVVSSDEAIKSKGRFFVVPLYRKPSKSTNSEDIMISPNDCRGMRYEEYAQALNVMMCSRCRVAKKIGHIKNNVIIRELKFALWKLLESDV